MTVDWDRIVTILAVMAALGGLYGTYRQSKATERKSVADIYGEALARLDVRLANVERQLEAEKAHSQRQDARLNKFRKALRAWATWGQQIHDDWAHVRLRDQPPPLPADASDVDD